MIKSTKLVPHDQYETKKFNIVGCGATGGKVAEELARAGVNNFTLWDGDTIGENNISNQIWTRSEIGMYKTHALAKRIMAINPNAKIQVRGFWEGELLSDIVINCVDSVELRKEIYEANYGNQNIEILFDPRVGNRGYSLYAYKWNETNCDKLIAASDFLDTEMEQEDRGPCGQKEYLNFVSWYATAAIMRNLRNYLSGDDFNKQEHWTILGSGDVKMTNYTSD